MTDVQHPDIAVVILAAGGSSRLGRPKQLLYYKGQTMVGHAAAAALAVHPGMVVVVTGRDHNEIVREIRKPGVEIVHNAQWEQGLAGSIKIGLDFSLQHRPNLQSVILMVCDQPYLTPTVLEQLIVQHKKTGKPIVASRYGNGATGTPVLINCSIFPFLNSLHGDTGAKKIISAQPDQTAFIDFPGGETDIDTASDYESLQP